jgi:four helix bundle protein
LKKDGEGTGSDIRERVFEFACAVVDVHRSLYRRTPELRSLTFQASNAATSIGANLEEADAAQSRADFVSKCTISLKEARESRYWLRILHRTLKNEKLAELIRESTQIIAILTTIVRKTKEHS